MTLSLSNIHKRYDSVHALKGVHLNVPEGAFYALLGPSSAGKTTALRVICGLETPDEGTVTLFGQRANDAPVQGRGLAMIFQSFALYPHLNVRGNMTLALKQEKQPKSVIDDRVATASKMLNLEDYLDRYPSELSGGQRQRVAIGRAIVREPKLFLFDEPLSNLDAALRMNTRIEIANLHRQLGASMIYVTHDQTEAMTLADKIVVMRDGCVEQIGSPMELYNNPANQFVAGFLGSPAMNFFPASTVNEGDDRILGVRPEDLFITSDGALSVRVSHVEQLGGDTNIIATMQGQQVTARLFGQHLVEPGQDLKLGFEPQKIFHFDAKGARLEGSA